MASTLLPLLRLFGFFPTPRLVTYQLIFIYFNAAPFSSGALHNSRFSDRSHSCESQFLLQIYALLAFYWPTFLYPFHFYFCVAQRRLKLNFIFSNFIFRFTGKQSKQFLRYTAADDIARKSREAKDVSATPSFSSFPSLLSRAEKNFSIPNARLLG